jgi:RNA polymerase sigma-54 factor
MALLELSADELEQRVQAELSSNPALEIRDPRRCPSCGLPLSFSGPQSMPCPRCSASSHASGDEPIVFISPRQDFYLPTTKYYEEELSEDELPQASEDLPTYVLRQIAPDLLPEDRPMAAFILSNLDEDGLLRVSLPDVAKYHHVPMQRVEGVVRLIQRADPVGVGCSSPQEALLVQLEVLAETQPIPEMTAEAICQGLDLLSRRQFAELGHRLKISSRQVQQIVTFISDNLNPYPARASWGDIRHGKGSVPDVYTLPDVIITRSADAPGAPLLIEIVSPYAGLLRINPLFRQALNQAPPDKSEQWKSDMERADLLVKCLQQRNHTLVRLVTRIAILQRAFILYGDSQLEPLTRASLADTLELHESTISRAVSGKTVQLPNGHMIPLAKFFDRSLNVRTALKNLIAQEITPLSDSELAELLTGQGFSVARRTVAKYRAMEGILPSHLRPPANQTATL